MKVALWADNVLDPNMSGMGYHQAQLLLALDRLQDQHEYLAFCTPRRPGQRFPLTFDRIGTRALPGLRHLYYPLWHNLHWPGIDRFLPAVDLVHLLHASVAVPARRPTIVHVVDLASKRFPDAYPYRRRVYKDLAIERAVRQPATRFTVISQFVKDELCTLYNVAPHRVAVVHLGVDRKHFRRAEQEQRLAELRQRFGLQRPFFLFVGAFSPRKNLETLVRGVSRFNRRAGESHELVLAGASGWYDDAVYEAAHEAGCVRFTGYVPDADLPALYSLAEALVYPSSYEGFGLPLVEAMACGTPVIASKLTSIPEVVGDAALLLEEVTPEAIAMALEGVAADAALRTLLVQRGLERAELFTWEGAALRCRTLYERMAQEWGMG